MTDDRPLDASTGRPRMMSDAEAADLIRTQHADKWADRDGQTIRLYILKSGLTLNGRVLERGQVLEVEVGSDTYVSSCDPQSGASFLELDAGQQLQRWGVRYYDVIEADETIVTAEDDSPFADDKPNRPDPARSSKRKLTPNDTLQSIYREQEAMTDGPVRIVSAERRFLRDGTEF